MTVGSIDEHATGRARPEAPQRVRAAIEHASAGTSPAAMQDRLDANAFAELAQAVAAHQYDSVPAFRSWWDASGATGPASDWEAVPALPIEAFKRLAVHAAGVGAPAAEWHSSGTTSELVSRHVLPSLDLYEASLRGPALAMLVPEGATSAGLAVVQLAPDGATAPHSSLSHMLDIIRNAVDRNHAGISGVYEDAAAGLRIAAAISALKQAATDDVPVLILTTSFALVHLLDHLAASATRIPLPDGSRLMDTGGYKGRSRSVSQHELLGAVTQHLGIPPSMCENEYGMSELSSQAWLGTIHRTVTGREAAPGIGGAGRQRVRWQPPWMRSRVVDPSNLGPVPDGSEGLLVHVDLANAYTCSFVRTEDWAARVGDSYELLGRAPGAELRGCSLRLEDVLQWT